MKVEHFEQLWSVAEDSFKSELDCDVNEILNKLSLSIRLYKNINDKSSSTQEIKAIKAHLLGELLLEISHLSMKENIDVFNALMASLKFRKSHLNQSSSEVPSP